MIFQYRVMLGVLFFIILGLVDYWRHPSNPRRAKEYLFLFSCAGIAMAYGVVHDFVTYHISPDYFIWGKGIESAVDGFNLDVVKLALMAAWSAGLIAGVVLLIANNPRRGQPQLSYPALYSQGLVPLGGSMVFGGTFGLLCFAFALRFSDYLPNLQDSPAERRFMTTWGIHVGSYLGGAVGLILAAVRITRRRKQWPSFRNSGQ